MIHTSTLTIPKAVTQGADLVVLKKKEFLQFKQQFVEVMDALQAIREGETAFRAGKTKRVASLRELL